MRLNEPRKELKLNIGCGNNKLDGYVNIDTSKECNPDICMNIAKRALPYANHTVTEILCFHCIEHIQKFMHRFVLMEFQRVLKHDCKLYVSYPNFWECAKNWKNNRDGQKRFWEATLYGRQLYKEDYHVCAMDPDELTLLLYECGFDRAITTAESGEYYNNLTVAVKSRKPVLPLYEDVVAADMKNIVIKKGA